MKKAFSKKGLGFFCVFAAFFSPAFFASIFFACSSYFSEIKGESEEVSAALLKNYSVEHYFQNANDNGYAIDGNETERLSGKSGSQTCAKAKEFAGFFCVGTDFSSKADSSVTQKAISDDGSTTVKIYYDRKIVSLVLDAKGFFEDGNERFEAKDAAFLEEGPVIAKGRFGADISECAGFVQEGSLSKFSNTSPPATMRYEGFVFFRWEPATFCEEDGKTAKAVWKKEGTAQYEVRHHFQNISGSGFDLDTPIESYIFFGAKNSKTQAKEISKAGFSCVGTDAANASNADFSFSPSFIEQKEISEDGKTAVDIFYKRNSYSVTLDANGGRFPDGSQTKAAAGLFEAEIPKAAAFLPASPGSVFLGWSLETFPASEGKTAKAVWKADADVPYKVRHVGQNVSGSEYEVTLGEEELFGRAGLKTAAAANFYQGFSCVGTEKDDLAMMAQKTVAIGCDNDITIFYKRNLCTVTLDANGGRFPDGSQTKAAAGLFEAEIPKAAAFLPASPGSVFLGWSLETFPASEGKTAKAVWKADADVPYKVRHHFQDIQGSGYGGDKAALVSSFAGKNGTKSRAEILSDYEGFYFVGTSPAPNAEEESSFGESCQIVLQTGGNNDFDFYYNRKKYTVTLDLNPPEGKTAFITLSTSNNAERQFSSADGDAKIKDRFGSAITILQTQIVAGSERTNPYAQGYVLDNWAGGSPLYVNSDKTHTAKWKSTSAAISVAFPEDPPSATGLSRGVSGDKITYTMSLSGNAMGFSWSINGGPAQNYEDAIEISGSLSQSTIVLDAKSERLPAGVYQILCFAFLANGDVLSEGDRFMIEK